jgi:hypothetical protein
MNKPKENAQNDNNKREDQVSQNTKDKRNNVLIKFNSDQIITEFTNKCHNYKYDAINYLAQHTRLS